MHYVHADCKTCNVCEYQNEYLVSKERQKNWENFHKDQTNYQVNEVNMEKKFMWLVEHLTADLAEDLPGGIEVKNYIKGCQIDLPDLACFSNGTVKFLAKTGDDGCASISYESFSLHDIRRIFSVVVRKRKKTPTRFNALIKRHTDQRPKPKPEISKPLLSINETSEGTSDLTSTDIIKIPKFK